MTINIKRNMDGKILPEELRKFIILWGADDCYFEFKEISETLQVSRAILNGYVFLLKKDFPETYEYYSKRRQRFRNQSRYENKGREWSNDYLNDNVAWEREGEPKIIKNSMKPLEDENFTNHGYYANNE